MAVMKVLRDLSTSCWLIESPGRSYQFHQPDLQSCYLDATKPDCQGR